MQKDWGETRYLNHDSLFEEERHQVKIIIFQGNTSYLHINYCRLFWWSSGLEIAICMPSAKGIHFLVSPAFASSLSLDFTRRKNNPNDTKSSKMQCHRYFRGKIHF